MNVESTMPDTVLVCRRCDEFKGIVKCDACGELGCLYCSTVNYEDCTLECDHDTITELNLDALELARP